MDANEGRTPMNLKCTKCHGEGSILFCDRTGHSNHPSPSRPVREKCLGCDGTGDELCEECTEPSVAICEGRALCKTHLAETLDDSGTDDVPLWFVEFKDLYVGKGLPMCELTTRHIPTTDGNRQIAFYQAAMLSSQEIPSV